LDNAPSPFVILGKKQPIYTPDGKYLIAAGVNGSADEHNVMIWDLATRSIVGKYDAERRLSALAMSPNGNFLAGGGADGTLILWNRETRRRLWVAKEHKKHFDCLSLRDDGLVAAANSDGTLKVFEPSDGNVRFWLSLEDPKLRGALGLDPEPRKVMFSPNGRWIAVGSKPPKIGQQLVNSKPAEIIDAATGRQVAQFGDGHFLPTFSPDRNTIATARLDDRYSKIVLSSWDGNDLTNERSWQVGKDVNAPVYDLCFNANGEHLAAMRRQDDLDVWDVKTTTEIASWGGLFRANWLTIHPKKGQLAFCHVDRRIHLWNYARQDPEATVTKLDEPARLVKFSPDGKLIAVGSVADHRNFSPGAKRSDSAGIVTVLGTASSIVVCKFSGRLVNSPWLPDSERIVVLGPTNSFEIWNTRTGILDRSVRETIEDKFSAFVDGRTVTSVERGAGGPRIRIWDTDTGELITDFLAEVEGAGKSIVAGVPDFNHQDKRVAIGNMNSKIEIWDTESQSLTRTLKTLGRLHFVLRFSRDGNRLFIGELGGHGLAVQDFESEREFQFQGVSSKIPSFAVSPDGAQLVAQTEIVDNSDAKKLTVYDVATSQPLVTLLSSSEAQRKGPGGPAQFDWSADGQRIAAILPLIDELYIWTLPQVP
jgi:WD40 repeat protein